jgi:hypothetical protein
VRDTVIGLTPAREATSLIVGWRAPRDVDMPALLCVGANPMRTPARPPV